MLLGSGDHRWPLKDDGKIHSLIGTHLSGMHGTQVACSKDFLCQKSEEDPGRAQYF